MKAVLISTAVLLFVGLVAGATVLGAQRKATMLPANTPAKYLESQAVDRRGPVVVFVGDSLTHGAVSSNYIELLEERGVTGYELINAGINGQLSYNVFTRLDEIAACDPEIITVLIGTNDANSLMSVDNQNRYVKDQKLPRIPDTGWFTGNIKAIAAKLTATTDARVAFLSLPTIGEDPSHAAFELSSEYSRIIKEAAAEAGVTYLPLHEIMVNRLVQAPGGLEHDFSEMRGLMVKAILRRYTLGQSWNKIGEINGFALHTDHLHLNTAGAEIVADLIADFILETDKR